LDSSRDFWGDTRTRVGQPDDDLHPALLTVAAGPRRSPSRFRSVWIPEPIERAGSGGTQEPLLETITESWPSRTLASTLTFNGIGLVWGP
jgi:hypothetical protein